MRQFSKLKPEEKVKAILGGVLEPVTREQALRFAQIDYEKLEDNEKKEVDAVFEECRKKGSEDSENCYHFVGNLPAGIKRENIDRQISRVILERYRKTSERK